MPWEAVIIPWEAVIIPLANANMNSAGCVWLNGLLMEAISITVIAITK